MSSALGGFAESDPVGSRSNMSIASLYRVLPRGEVGDVKHRGRNLVTESSARLVLSDSMGGCPLKVWCHLNMKTKL